MGNPEHSPLPLRVQNGSDIRDANGNTVADALTLWRTDEEDNEFAEFIVRAVNQSPHFEAAVKALEDCADELQNVRNSILGGSDTRRLQLKTIEQAARGVLAKIKKD